MSAVSSGMARLMSHRPITSVHFNLLRHICSIALVHESPIEILKHNTVSIKIT